jgi:hypothetical protein
MEGRIEARAAILAALIVAAATIGAAVIGKWEDFFPPSQPQSWAKPSLPAPTGAERQNIPAAPIAEEGVAPSLPKEARRLTPVEAPVVKGPATTRPAAIAGRWRDDKGFDIWIDQRGSEYSYTGISGNVSLGTGTGNIVGRSTRSTYRTADSSGSCRGEVNVQGNVLTGTCTTSSGETTPFRMTR